MVGDASFQRKAQLDKREREHLEAVVTEMRDRVENNVEFRLTRLGLDTEPEDLDTLEGDARSIAEAIDLEGAEGHGWGEAFEQYVTGVGYTIVNRLAALRCMEVRDFTDEEVTVFKDNSLTPAAETLVHEEFLLEDEAIIRAYRDACDELAEEIEILFDSESAYSQLDPDRDTFEDLCVMLDSVPDEVWRADDVLGWIYEYYNRPIVEALDAKNTLEPEDVGPANQFYTPHWVVRMLTDNSLGKLYLEATGQESTVPEPAALSPEARKERPVTPADSPSVPELCTYLIPDEEPGDAPDFDHPRELRVIDPACGSGHFLLYAFDVLERIWWAETDLDRAEIPAKVLEHNLSGVDIDLRSCQLTAFNLYLKARTRAEAEGGRFEMPTVDIVCADARVAELEEGAEVLDEITGEGTELREALAGIIDTFQHTEALGSLLDVSGTLEDVFESGQTGLGDWSDGTHRSLNSFLRALREAVDERSSDSFGERNLRSFLNLLVVLTQEYDVALMNPPYGSGGRMPDGVQAYVEEHYEYPTEYYINFFEACDGFTRENGRVGMLVPWSFMFRKWFQGFREDFVGEFGAFDFFTEFGYDVLDNATVGTVGTVIRSGTVGEPDGTFVRLADVDKENKERQFARAAFETDVVDGVRRRYRRDVSEFDRVPGTPMSYWVPDELRAAFTSDAVIDADNAGLERESAGHMSQGLATADDGRFVRYFWETTDREGWSPFAKGGADSEFLPQLKHTVRWGDASKEVTRYVKSYPRNVADYGTECLTYTVFKRGGRRFGYLHEGAVFSHVGSVVVPDRDIWTMLGYANSHLFSYLMIAQTQERNWDVGLVSRMPWPEALEGNGAHAESAKEAVGHVLSERKYEFVSPHYDGPVLLDVLGVRDPLSQYEHPHRVLSEKLTLEEPAADVGFDADIETLGVAAAKHRVRTRAKLQSCVDEINAAVFDCFGITDEQRETVLQEIALRTIEDPRERDEHDPETVSEPSEEFPEQVKDLLLHFTLRAVSNAEDGIVPLSDLDGEDDLLTRIEAEFERVWGEHAQARLVEVDGLLGTQSAAEEAYPNLRTWLENDLFAYHVSKFDRTPVLWRFTTERLVSDPEGEGFGCLVDYHRLDEGVFDRLQHRYLEPRKARLRERRSAANRRRSDGSLSTAEQAEAAAEYARCESGIEQIDVFEGRLAELAQTTPREWPKEQRQVAAEATDRVAEFRERTEKRLEAVDELAGMDDVDMAELFTGNFYGKVETRREEWIDALADLEAAFDAYAADPDEPVEAHLYDLFEYYVEDLLGSSHFASNGILYMTYYFDGFEEPDQARLDDAGVSRRQRLIARLASDLDDYIELGESISDDCERVSTAISGDWADRALSEVTTAGYRPKHGHGVEINIGPLAEAEIVPKTVDDRVL